MGDRDSLDLGCSGSVTRDKGKDVLGVHPGDELWVESEDPSLSHHPPPRRKEMVTPPKQSCLTTC